MTNEPALRSASVGWFPPTPALAEAVRTRLPSTPDARRRRVQRAALVVAIAILVLVGTAIAASRLDLVPGVRIHRVDRLPEVSCTWQPSGTQVGLEDARRSVPFTLLLPSGTQRPDRILLDRDHDGAPVVTAIYGGRERASLVLTQWEANDVLFDKLVGHDTARSSSTSTVPRASGSSGSTTWSSTAEGPERSCGSWVICPETRSSGRGDPSRIGWRRTSRSTARLSLHDRFDRTSNRRPTTGVSLGMQLKPAALFIAVTLSVGMPAGADSSSSSSGVAAGRIPEARALRSCAGAGPYWPTMTLALSGNTAWVACKEQARLVRMALPSGRRTARARSTGR